MTIANIRRMLQRDTDVYPTDENSYNIIKSVEASMKANNLPVRARIHEVDEENKAKEKNDKT